MKYCTRCLYPDTKPDLWFNEDGLCSACIAYDKRAWINWIQREEEFIKLVETIKNDPNKNPYYDCVVGVSGGKDSHYQILQCLKYGLRPLAVCARTDFLSELGRINLDNIANCAVDLIEVNPNRRTRFKLMKHALKTCGDISWTEHVLIFTAPLLVAKEKSIKCIIWGENPQNEYGGPKEDQTRDQMKQNWLQEYGGLNGLRVSDLVADGTLKPHHSYYYTPPTDISDIKQVFLGQYFDWDGKYNAEFAQKYGFKWSSFNVETVGFQYENLDNYATGLHDYFKYIKFGFGRATDICSNNIRRGRLSRDEAIRHIKLWETNVRFPHYYLGLPYGDILNELGMSTEELEQIIEYFTNPVLFDKERSETGSLFIKPKFEPGINNDQL